MPHMELQKQKNMTWLSIEEMPNLPNQSIKLSQWPKISKLLNLKKSEHPILLVVLYKSQSSMDEKQREKNKFDL